MATLAEMLNATRSITVAGHEIHYRQITMAQAFNAVMRGLRDQSIAIGQVPLTGQKISAATQKCLEDEDWPTSSYAPMIFAATKGLNKGLIEKLKDAEALTTIEHLDGALELIGAICGSDEKTESDKAPKAGDNGRAEGNAEKAAAEATA